MKFVRLLLFPLIAVSFLGMAKKPNNITVRFHVEANARDGESFAMPVKFRNPDRDGFLQRVPAISERDIKAVYPVPAADGTFGCVFELDIHGAIGLQTFSTERRGLRLVALVSSAAGPHQVADMVIDKPITDGVIFVASGFSKLEIDLLQKDFPTIGQTAKRK